MYMMKKGTFSMIFKNFLVFFKNVNARTWTRTHKHAMAGQMPHQLALTHRCNRFLPIWIVDIKVSIGNDNHHGIGILTIAGDIVHLVGKKLTGSFNSSWTV